MSLLESTSIGGPKIEYSLQRKKMEIVHYDVIALILARLDVESFAKLAMTSTLVLATCKRYAEYHYIGRGYAELAKGVGEFVTRLVREFTCLCGARSWSVAAG